MIENEVQMILTALLKCCHRLIKLSCVSKPVPLNFIPLQFPVYTRSMNIILRYTCTVRRGAFGLKHGTLGKGALCHSLRSPQIFIDCSDAVLPSGDLFIGCDSVHIKDGFLYEAQSVGINSFLPSRSCAIFVVQFSLRENMP